MRVLKIRSVESERQKDKLWEIYERAFAESQKYPHDQVNYTRKTLFNALVDPTVIKFIAFDNQDNILGYAIVIEYEHSHHSPWTNFDAFIGTEGNPRGFFYINVLVADANVPIRTVGFCIINKIIDWVEDKQKTLAGFDVPQGKERVVELIRACCRRRGYDVKLVGSQQYYSIYKDHKGGA